MDPSAAVGGLIAICVVVVLPIAFGIHLLSKRYLLLSVIAVPVTFTLVNFAFFGAMDDRTNAPAHRWGLELAWWSFWPALSVSIIAAVPILIYKAYRWRRPTT